MSNFAFLPDDFRDIAESAVRAEGYVSGDPRAACFHARFALEVAVHWLFRRDPALRMPYDDSLGALLHEPTFQNLLPRAVFQKARVIQRMGNRAVHDPRPVRPSDAMLAVKELFHVCYWLTRTYAPDAIPPNAAWRDDRVPEARGADAVPRAELEALGERLAEQSRLALEEWRERDALDAEVRRAGWLLDSPRAWEYRVTGMPNAQGEGYADYVLWGDDGKPLAVVEAKRTTVDPAAGRQQAKLYADCLETMHGQRPVIFFTNGYETWLWDDAFYPPRTVAGFFTKDELSRLILRRSQRGALDVAQVQDAIVERYYRKRAIGSIFAQFAASRRKALLVMATGTGKTRTAIALVDALQRAGWVKRALFLADRVSLVHQAVNAFKRHLPESSPVNLVTDKEAEGASSSAPIRR